MKTGSQMKLKHVYSGTCLANDKFMEKLSKILQISKSDTAKYREGVIEFHDKYGTPATKDAYGIGKTTIYEWRKRYLKARKDATVLIPKSTRPINVRNMQTDSRIVGFVRDQRLEHYRIGKEKIKPLLDEYCLSIGINSVSEPTIGRIIKKHNMFYQKKGRIYHNPSFNYKIKGISYKSRVKHSPKELRPGYIEIDTITRFHQGKRLYVINGVDVFTRFSFSYAYTTLSSKNGMDYLQRLQHICSFHTVQTDNGLEFHKYFHEYLQKNNIQHIFTYPRCPRINGFIERCNRSLSEEFIESHLLDIFDMSKFNEALQLHNIWYNTKRIHRGLKNLTPLQFINTLST